jgi:hypothetical protein
MKDVYELCAITEKEEQTLNCAKMTEEFETF